MSRDALVQVVDKIADEAIELIPVAIKALEGLLAGKPPEQVLAHAEREVIARQAQKVFDDALKNAHGRPNTGG